MPLYSGLKLDLRNTEHPHLLNSPDNQEKSETIVGQNGFQHGLVEINTQNKLQQILHDQENDPQFQYYNSEGESEHSNAESDVQDFAPLVNDGENESPSLNGRMWNNNLRGEDYHGGSGKNVAQSNLQKHKSLSTPLFDLTKLDAVDVDIDADEEEKDWGMENVACDSDSDNGSGTGFNEPQCAPPFT